MNGRGTNVSSSSNTLFFVKILRFVCQFNMPVLVIGDYIYCSIGFLPYSAIIMIMYDNDNDI